MDERGPSQAKETDGKSEPPATASRRTSNADGWCTTLQQPAALGLLGFVVAHLRRRRSRG